jgi:hypothetical protein
MLNQVKSTFTVPSPRFEAKALVEAFARQDKQQLYPFELQKFTLGVRFQNAEPQTQRVIVMAVLAWLDQHSLKSYGHQDQNDWQVGWKMREAFLQMLKFKIPFQEQDVIAMLDWSASQSSASVYVYFSGVPQIIKVTSNYLKNNPMSDPLHAAIERLIQSIESRNMSVEIRRWVLQLRELTKESEVNLPLAAGDAWADTALREIHALNSRTQTAWAELLIHCLRATTSAPSKRWLERANKYLDTIGKLNFFNKAIRWFRLVGKPRAISIDRHENRYALLPVNTDILKGLAWLCSKSDDPEIPHALSALAISSYKKIPGAGPRAGKVGNACFWALGNMPSDEGIAQLSILKIKIKTEHAQKLIANALKIAAKRMGVTAEEIEEMSMPRYELDAGLHRQDVGEAPSELEVEDFFAG